LALVEANEVTRVEAELNTAFPDGYREFMTRFGRGEFCGVLGVLAPREVVKRRDELRKYGVFNEASETWENFDSLFPDGDPREIIPVAGSIDGDEVVFFRGKPEVLWSFPRQDRTIYKIGRTFLEALAWYQKAGVVIGKSAFAYFNSGVDQRYRLWNCSGRGRDWMSLRRDLEEIAGPATVEHRDPGDSIHGDSDAFHITRRHEQALLSTCPLDDDVFQVSLRCDKHSGYEDVLQSALTSRKWKLLDISGRTEH
jgi:hypothetical protein